MGIHKWRHLARGGEPLHDSIILETIQITFFEVGVKFFKSIINGPSNAIKYFFRGQLCDKKLQLQSEYRNQIKW